MQPDRRRFLELAAAGATAAFAGCASQPAPSGAQRMRVIDTHAHFYPQSWVDLIEREAGRNGAKTGRNERGLLTMSVPGLNATFQTSCIDVDFRLKAMDAAGVDVHALSLTQPMVYWAPPAFGLRLSQEFNDGCSALHLKHPQRLVGTIMLPMQEPRLAVEELERAAKLPGMRAVYMATHVNGRNLDEKAFWPVYERAEGLGLPIFLHPVNPVGAERMRSYYLRNFLGNPYDTGIAAASLMFGGVMDAFPKLDVMLPHAGGTFPALIGRMTHGASVRPETKHMTKAPITYLRRFHYDTIAHNGVIMLNVVRQAGADRVVLGSDYRADMGYDRPVDFVEKTPDLTAAERAQILGENAARLLRI